MSSRWNVAFPDWLLSLNDMHLSFLHFFSQLDSSSLLLLRDIPLREY